MSPHEIELGLARVLEVLARLHLAQPARVVHVAGTNGKGSSALMLEALLLQTGVRVGCYMSPHIRHYNERIRVDGSPVDDRQIINAFEAVDAARHGVPLTYFEFGTLAALVVFDRQRVHSAVLEIGMGGRLDAVNAVQPDAGIITNVTLDHCDWLGPDVETIAREKAGIMRAGRPVVFGADAVPHAIVSEAGRIAADLRLPGRDFHYTTDRDKPGEWTWNGRNRTLAGLRKPSLFGRVQLRNASAVLALVEALHLEDLLSREFVDDALGGLSMPGRFQRVESGRTWLFDVAHNADAAKVLGESLSELAHPGPVVAVIGLLADKDGSGIIDSLDPSVDTWVAVNARSTRAVDARELAQTVANLSAKPCLVMGNVAEALGYVDRHAPHDALVLVSGSFYTVGPALDWLERASSQS